MKELRYDAQTGGLEYKEYTPDNIPEIEILQMAQYENKVIELIRQMYTIDEELAIQRQKETKPNEFEIYFNYCEECKLKAKEQFNYEQN